MTEAAGALVNYGFGALRFGNDFGILLPLEWAKSWSAQKTGL